MNIDRLLVLLSEFANQKLEWVGHSIPPTVILNNNIKLVCEKLREHPETFFDQLSCITGLDNGSEAGTMEVIYTLYSIPFHQSLMLKVILLRSNPEIETVSSIWKSANWMEREAFDMYGIKFLNHSDLRRILMPADWEGFPLRKDYQEQETYRNIKLAPES